MLDDQKRDFKEMMIATMALYQQEISVGMLRMWWASLSGYELNDVRDAISRHVQDKTAGKFVPRPANIIEQLDAMHPDGRIGADEAWALYPHDEHASAVITDEMAEAMRVAQPLLNEGDKIGARMAFKDAYNRITSQNKFNGTQPRWFPSLGSDKEGRDIAINDAVAKGRLSQDHATSLLPAPVNSNVAAALSNIKFLTKPESITDDDREKARGKMAQIKSMLGRGHE